MAWYRIKAQRFQAAVQFKEGKVAKAPPLLQYLMGWSKGRVIGHCRNQHWDVDYVRAGLKA